MDTFYKGLKSRDELAKKLKTLYINGCAEKVMFIKGTSGSGKSYIINSFINKVNNIEKSNLSIYINQGDELLIQNKNFQSNFEINEISVSIGTPVISIGGGIAFQKRENQYQIIRKLLKKDKSKQILFCIDNFSKSENTIKLFIKFIAENIYDLENKYNKNLFILITDLQDYSFNNYLKDSYYPPKTLNLIAYSFNDILNYLKNNHSTFKFDNDFKTKIKQVQKICNGNLALVDFLFVDMQFQNSDYFEALERIVNQRLIQLKSNGLKENISESDMEDIILSSSLCSHKFTSVCISKITNRETNTVSTSLNIAKNDVFLDKDNDCFFEFHCDEIHEILRKQSILKHKERLLYYYQYYTETEQDEYYLRSYYLTSYYGYFSSQSFSLLILAYISAMQLQDYDKIGRIKKLLEKYAYKQQMFEFERVQKFYEIVDCRNSNIEIVYKEYKELKRLNFELPLKGALARLCFHFYYVCTSPENKYLKLLADECMQYAQNELELSYFFNPIELQQYDETIIRLMTIYEIAPYILDVLNDYEGFNKLYYLSKQFTLKTATKSAMGLAQYIQNVFNRKAFLFVNPTQCEIYYEKAKKYFYDNNFLEEYCITLVCQAGTDIIIQKYEEAKDNCILAKRIADEEDFVIPQLPKLNNNFYIANFLEYEETEKNIDKCFLKAQETAELLNNELTGKPCATEFVILTNICSLYLYCNNEKKYLNYKKRLEIFMPCSDVADVFDENIDDFYRYYFSWFEIYRAIKNERWEEAEILISKTKGFVPALFEKQEVFWDKKTAAVQELVHERKTINSYEFCNCLVKTERRETLLSKFFFRGLMLSDIQYTSYY